MTKGHALPGWPAEVLAPDIDGWVATAVEWLLDYGDPTWRLDPLYRAHPAILARAAQVRAHALVEAARRQWGELAEYVPSGLPEEAAAGARALLKREGPVLRDRAAAIDLVREALTGVRWVPKL